MDKEAEKLLDKCDLFIASSINSKSNNDSILYYTNKAYAIVKNTQNKKMQGWCLGNIASYYSRQGDYKSAEKEYFKALKQYEEIGDKKGIAAIQINLAGNYNNLKEFYNVIRYALLVEKFYKETDPKRYAFVTMLLGRAYEIIQDFDSARKYNKLYKEYILNTDSYLEIGQYYLGAGSLLEAEKANTDSILYNYIKAKEFILKSQNKTNIAMIYCKLAMYYDAKNDVKNALKNIDSSSRFENDPEVFGKEDIYSTKCAVYSSAGNLELAEKNGLKALDYAKKTNNNYTRQLVYDRLAQVYHKHNLNGKAYEMAILSDKYYSINFDNENLDRIQNLKSKYEHEQSVRDIDSLKQKNTIQSLLLIIAGILLVFIIIITIILLNRRKLKAKSKLDEEIRKQQEINIAEVIKAEELERRRIAEHLHDGVGAGISAAILNVSVLNDIAEIDSQELHIKNNKILNQLRTVYDDLRTISHQMMPNSLIKAGLPSALKEFVNSVDNNKLEVSLYIHGLEARFNESVELIVYRAIQEIVTNVIKHANASKLKIELIKDSEGLHIMIEDNGIGFDKAAINNQNGIGIQNMISKIEFLNGTIDFDTSIGKGTLVVIYLPLLD